MLQAFLIRACVPHLVLYVLAAILFVLPWIWGVRFLLLTGLMVTVWVIHIVLLRGTLLVKNSPAMPELRERAEEEQKKDDREAVGVGISLLLVALMFLVGIIATGEKNWLHGVLFLAIVDGGPLTLMLLAGFWWSTFRDEVWPHLQRCRAVAALRQFYQENQKELKEDLTPMELESLISSEMGEHVGYPDAWRFYREVISRYRPLAQQRRTEARQRERERRQKQSRLLTLQQRLREARRQMQQVSMIVDPDLREIQMLEHQAALEHLQQEYDLLLSTNEGEEDAPLYSG